MLQTSTSRFELWAYGSLWLILHVACGGCLHGQELSAVPAAANDDREFPEIYNSEPELSELLSPEQALDSLRLPDGFRATLYAAEPEVQNPIAATMDAQGRLWVAENYTYAERAQRFDLNLNDRVVVLEDRDGDGHSDSRVVFSETLKMLTGIVVGRGGVWVMCPPQLMFIPDRDGDLIPDGPAEVKLDGFTVGRENYHNFANGLSWGPDNWLYGRCGASCAGEIGIPGSVVGDRVPIRGGMWRFHPETHAFEVLTHGTTNPWGHDWNGLGDLFFINTVNGHLWHALPGAHFVRAHTLDINPHVYQLLDMHADHWHFDTGKSWTDSRDGAANDFGGGHAHVGMCIYQEDQWPERFRGRLMTVNMHGRRINCEQLKPSGSGYVAGHDPDFLLSDDTWFRGMDIIPTPDGHVLVIDWSDTGECHDSTGVHRTSGRIFKVSYDSASAGANPLTSDMIRADSLELAKLQLSGTTWQSRRARELLAQHRQAGNVSPEAIEFLRKALQRQDLQVEFRLRALWSLIAVDGVTDQIADELLQSSSEHLRTWAVRFVSDDWRIDRSDGKRPSQMGTPPPEEVIRKLSTMARLDPSPSVRLALASVLQRLPHESRPELASGLLRHQQDAGDHNIPLMVWFGLTPIADQHLGALVELLAECHWPVTRRLMARRIAGAAKVRPTALDSMLETAAQADSAFQADVLLGMAQAFAGWQKVDEPAAWPALKDALGSAEDDRVRSAIQNLSILFGDGRAIEELIQIAGDGDASIELRKASLSTLVNSRADGIKELCLRLLSVRFLNTVAVNGLARESDASVGKAILKNYRRFHPFDRPQAISVLASRAIWAKLMLQSVQQGRVDRTEISAFQARQIASLNSPELDKLLLDNWGQVRTSSAEKQAKIVELRAELTSQALAAADRSHGRKLFNKSCANCHTLFGQGGKLGPDLTGAQRGNLDYLLENVVDPSAVVTKEFRATILLLEDDRVLTGLVTSQTNGIVTLATQLETFRVPQDEIAEMKLSASSTMPDGLLDQFDRKDIQDLFGYLQSTSQVELE